jgi:hypothetical protein
MTNSRSEISPFGGEDFQTNLSMSEPTVFLIREFPVCSTIHPTEATGAAVAAFDVAHR